MDPRPYVDDIDGFNAYLARSRLVDPEQLHVLMKAYRSEFLPSANLPNTITSLCSFLVGRGVLTTWQCGKLRRGQYKSFFLDQFKLMDTLGHDDDFGYYLALDTQTGGFVKLAITPAAKMKGTAIEYRLRERFE